MDSVRVPSAPSQTPVLSIGMPIKNGQQYMRLALDSLLAQSLTNLELLLSDNASTDNTVSIAAEYMARDKRVRYVRHDPEIPVMENFAFCLRESRAPYFMWAGHDDLWEPDFALKLVSALDCNQRAVAAFCSYSIVDALGVERRDVLTPDYTGSGPLQRIVKFLRRYDDRPIYGIFRREALRDLQFPRWRGINRAVVQNASYPPICYLLSKGEYEIVAGEPLWHYRVHAKHEYVQSAFLNRPLASFGAFVLRKANLGLECARYAHLGGSSPATLVGMMPALCARFVWDVGHQLVTKTRPALNRFLKLPANAE